MIFVKTIYKKDKEYKIVNMPFLADLGTALNKSQILNRVYLTNINKTGIFAN